MSADKITQPESAAKAPAPPSAQRYSRKRIALVAASLVVFGCAVTYMIVKWWPAPKDSAAQDAIARRDFAEARRLLEKGLDANPNDRELRLLAAQTARQQGDFRAALGHLQACEQRGVANPGLDLEHRLLRVQQGDLTEADALLALCAKYPSDAQTPLILEAVIEGSLNVLMEMLQREWAGQGELSSSELGRAQRAIDDWFELRTGLADQVQGNIWRGLLHGVARDHLKSEGAFRKAVELDPDHFQARHFLAALLATEAPEEAATHFEILHKRERNNDMVSFALAQVCRSTGRLDRAAELLDDLLSRDPDHAPALIERGRVALDQRKPKDAERWLKRAVDAAPNHPQANLAFSQCLQQTDRATEAKVYYDKYLRSEAQMKPPHDGLTIRP